MTTYSPEIALASAVKALEPQKVRGGSPKRRAWIKLHMDIMEALHALGGDMKKFQEEVLK